MKDTEIPRDRRWSTIFDPMYEMVDEVELAFGGVYFVAALLFVKAGERKVMLFHKTPDADDLRDNWIPPLKVIEILIQYYHYEKYTSDKDFYAFLKETAISLLLRWLDFSFRIEPEILERIKTTLENQKPLIKCFFPRIEILFIVEYNGFILFPKYAGGLKGHCVEVDVEEIFRGEWKTEKPTLEFLKEIFAKT